MWKKLAVMAAGLATASTTWAFCGTYVGSAGAELYNTVAQVVMVRIDDTTVLTFANDVEGDTDDFAVVVPVPEVLAREDVNVADVGIFARLDAYSAPRLVSYDCADFAQETDADTDADSDTDTDADTDWDVDVEAEYVVGEYEVVILSAEESGDLYGWLSSNGYEVPVATVPLLDSYIDAGQYFLAAKVSPASGVQPGDVLSPLQLRYTSPTFSLPIRIGTTSSPGVQDVLLYAVVPYEDGTVGIANYPEGHVEDDCMAPVDAATVGPYYLERFEEAHAAAAGLLWVREYSWGNGGCDPCSGEPPNEQDLATLGWELDRGPLYQLTRLHLRYTPEEATQDLALYTQNYAMNDQIRFITYDRRLEEYFPVCGVGMVEDGGTCDGDTGTPGGDDTGTPGGDDSGADDDHELHGDCGCATGGGGAWLGLLAVLALRRRR